MVAILEACSKLTIVFYIVKIMNIDLLFICVRTITGNYLYNEYSVKNLLMKIQNLKKISSCCQIYRNMERLLKIAANIVLTNSKQIFMLF